MRHITGGKIYKDGEGLHIKSQSTPSHTKIALLTRGSTRQRHRRYAEHQGQYRTCQPEKLVPAQSQRCARIPKSMRKLNTKPTIDCIRTFPAAIWQRVLVDPLTADRSGHPDRRRADPRYRRRRQGRNPLADHQAGRRRQGDHHDLERAARKLWVCPTASWSCMKARDDRNRRSQGFFVRADPEIRYQRGSYQPAADEQ